MNCCYKGNVPCLHYAHYNVVSTYSYLLLHNITEGTRWIVCSTNTRTSVTYSGDHPSGTDTVTSLLDHMISLQVHVTVNGLAASCSGDHAMYHVSSSKLDPCYFIYGWDLNPTATSITPTIVTNGDSVTIIGNKFSTIAMENVVKFGDVSCDVTSSSATMIICTLGAGEVGQKPLNIEVLNYGIATISDDLYINYTMSLAHVMPTSGSVAGGTVVTITGDGFLQDSTTCPMPIVTTTLCSDWTISVDINGQSCSVISTNSTDITCQTSMGSVGAADVTVTATCCHDSSLQFTNTIVGGFTFNSNVTATVSSITPTTGSAAGGDSVTITGSGFVTIETDSSLVAVMVSITIINSHCYHDNYLCCRLVMPFVI